MLSLIEVVVAIGVVVAGVAVILALLPGLLRRTEEAADLQTALRLPDAVETRLREEMAGAFPGGMQNGVVLVADKEGTNVRRESQLNVPPTPAYFYIDVRSFSSGELAYRSKGARYCRCVFVWGGPIPQSKQPAIWIARAIFNWSSFL
ncbi:MAG: hypothetical protein R3F03_10765 [Opitutaceae bacterium]